MKVTTRSMRFKFNLTFSTIRWSLCILIVRGFHASHFSFSKPRTGEVLLFVNCNYYRMNLLDISLVLNILLKFMRASPIKDTPETGREKYSLPERTSQRHRSK